MRNVTATIVEAREADGEEVDPVEVVVAEDQQPDRAAGQRRRQERASVERDTGVIRRLPESRREQEHRRGPQRVQHRALAVRVGGGLKEEDPVRDGGDQERPADQGPCPVGPPAGQREHADHGGEQQDVAERVGQVRDDHRPAAVGVPNHHLEEDCGSQRGRRDRRHRAVEPERPAELGEPGLHQEEQPDVAGGVEQEVEPVGNRRIRRTGAVAEVEHELGDRPRADADREGDPGSPLGPRRDSTNHRRSQGEQDQGVVPVPVEEVVEAAEAAAEQLVDDEERQTHGGCPLPGAHQPPRAGRGEHGHRHRSHVPLIGSAGVFR